MDVETTSDILVAGLEPWRPCPPTSLNGWTSRGRSWWEGAAGRARSMLRPSRHRSCVLHLSLIWSEHGWHFSMRTMTRFRIQKLNRLPRRPSYTSTSVDVTVETSFKSWRVSISDSWLVRSFHHFHFIFHMVNQKIQKQKIAGKWIAWYNDNNTTIAGSSPSCSGCLEQWAHLSHQYLSALLTNSPWILQFWQECRHTDSLHDTLW